MVAQKATIFYSHFDEYSANLVEMEASHSGLVHRLGKAAGSKGSREFESLRFRLRSAVADLRRDEIRSKVCEGDLRHDVALVKSDFATRLANESVD